MHEKDLLSGFHTHQSACELSLGLLRYCSATHNPSERQREGERERGRDGETERKREKERERGRKGERGGRREGE